MKCCNRHFDCVHNLPISNEAESTFKEFQKFEKALAPEADLALLAKCQNKFKLAAPRGSTTRARKPIYKCLLCNFRFQTSVAAMIKHAQDHDEHNYILIGRIKTGAYKGKLVPEHQCFNPSTGSTSFSAHYEFCTTIFPEDLRREVDGQGEKFFCIKCNKYYCTWSQQTDGYTLLSRRIKRMRRHELKCKDVKK